jgi:hypothetical protein
MLDFSKLKTPLDHGEVLLLPAPSDWLAAARANNKALRSADRPLLGSTLAHWRRETREAIVGSDDPLLIVLGHQPEFIHPGVWAKHITAARLATAADGVGLNLIVDCDAPKNTSLSIPSARDEHIVLRRVRYADLPAGWAYEQISRQSMEEVAPFAHAVREAMGDRYESSQMPRFFEAFAGARGARDWVDQEVSARQSVEASFGISLKERRVSSIWCTPLLIDMLLRPFEFAASYNRALVSYRRANRVRGARGLIPGLAVPDERCELPLWVLQSGQGRRRLFVSWAGDSLRLFAGADEIGTLPRSALKPCEDLEAAIAGLGGWEFRPRALTLTIWARLLLADLFIHGIGGAKYDRISDVIMADYYGVTPPQVVCVSATLHLGVPTFVTAHDSVRRLRHGLRDVEWNPQRHLPRSPDYEPLIRRRAEAVRRAIALREHEPGDRDARRLAFAEIRGINAAMLEARPEMLAAGRAELERARRELQQDEIARGRDYFFGLYDRKRLEQLTAALPDEGVFRV